MDGQRSASWDRAPRDLIAKAWAKRWTRENDAPDIVGYLLACSTLRQNGSVSIRQLADQCGWSRHRARRVLERVRADHPHQLPPAASKSPRNRVTIPSGQPNSGVYFVQGVDGGPIKIGYSWDVQTRVSALGVGSPVRLRVLAVIVGTGADEQELHQLLAVHRLHGEWFAPHSDVLAVIR